MSLKSSTSRRAARAHGRRETVTPRTFVLSEAVGMLQRLLARTIGSHIDVEQSLTAEGAIFADQGQVGQVVLNLILNACDAISEGGRISLSTRDAVRGAIEARSDLPPCEG